MYLKKNFFYRKCKIIKQKSQNFGFGGAFKGDKQNETYVIELTYN